MSRNRGVKDDIQEGETNQVECVVMWRPMTEAPTCGKTIIGDYGDGEECRIFWSDRPVCMLGSRCGGFPEGWATDGTETDYNLPVDVPIQWRECI